MAFFCSALPSISRCSLHYCNHMITNSVKLLPSFIPLLETAYWYVNSYFKVHQSQEKPTTDFSGLLARSFLQQKPYSKFSMATHTVPSLQNSMQFHITRGTQSAYMLIKNKVHAIVAYTTA